MDDFTYMYMGQPDDSADSQPDESTVVPFTASTPTKSSKTPQPLSRLHVDGAASDTASTAGGTTASTTEDNASAPPSPTAHHHRHHHHHNSNQQPQETPKRRRGFRDFFGKANLQDQLLDKLFQQVIPTDGMLADDAADQDMGFGDTPYSTPGQAGGGDGDDASRADNDDASSSQFDDGGTPPPAERPGFSVPIMSNNFRRFNARIGVVFRFQKKVERLLSWKRASHTLAFLGVYTFVCLDPYLLTLAGPAVMLLSVLIPGYIARHPGTPITASYASHSAGSPNNASLRPAVTDSYYARGPPLAPPRTVKPVKELSRDFFRNMGDLQNSMEDFSVAHDQVVELLVPATNFSDERFSSALFAVLCAVAVVLSLAAHLVPWRQVLLVGGWLGVWGNHPAVKRAIRNWQKEERARARAAKAARLAKGEEPDLKDSLSTLSPMKIWNDWIASDVILDEPPETREVEIFELQRRSAAPASEWEPWVFSPSPFDPLSQPRLANPEDAKPTGTRFFEDVLPPYGWQWSEKKWALDLWSRDWVEERIITGVEVETEGERWVYDIYNEHEQKQQQQHVAEAAAAGLLRDGAEGPDEDAALHPVRGTSNAKRSRGPGWEEREGGFGDDDDDGRGRRGAWRRRRWVRMVKRRTIKEAGY